MDIGSARIQDGCEALVRGCADLKSGEKALIVSDGTTRHLGEALAKSAGRVTDQISHHVIPAFTVHGQEPSEDVAEAMAQSDVIFGLTQMSMAHSQARFRASQAGARYLSLPDYSEAVMASPALQVDFRALSAVSDHLARLLTDGEVLKVETKQGTDLTCRIKERRANAAPGWCQEAGSLASPPDAETNIPLLEDSSNGILVVDGSIPCKEFGLLDAPLALTVKHGRVIAVEGPGADILNEIFDSQNNSACRVVAEFGLGLNPRAKLRGFMLEDEGCLGTAHLGIGSNATIGGTNSVPFHLDCIIRSVTVSIDGEPLVQEGCLLEK